MLTVYLGDDRDKALATWLAVKPDVRLDAEVLTPAQLGEHVVNASMFGEEIVISGRDLLANPEISEYVDKNIKELVSSPNHFHLLEAKVLAPLRKKIEKAGGAIKLFEKSERVRESEEREKKRENSKIFRLTDALLTRDRKNLWIEYCRALMSGIDPEEIFWKFEWQIKNLLIVSQTKNATEAGLHPYVYGKNKSALHLFSPSSLQFLASSLLDVWQTGHGSGMELDLALEQFILEI